MSAPRWIAWWNCGISSAALDGKWAGRWLGRVHLNDLVWVAGYAAARVAEGES